MRLWYHFTNVLAHILKRKRTPSFSKLDSNDLGMSFMYTFAIALPFGHAQIGNLSESSLLKQEQNPLTNGLLCWKVSPWFHPTIQLAAAKFFIQNAFCVLYIMCMIKSLYAKKTTAKNQSHLFASILAYLQHWLSLYAPSYTTWRTVTSD